ncbi:MAG: YggS family pyridoxal phosphate-dependent enzyme, partial [Candidatus Omnitrophica bacterium]|nr:YggS family pyridoxal phosphate-dependent enzyme [Candidatus Omnitrophota bacterium]
FQAIGNKAKWHFIGHLQKNKVKKAVKIFDMIETVDSLELAQEIDKACFKEKKIMPVLIEVNSGREKQKFGVFPEDVEELIGNISQLKNINVMGLMTMGPMSGDPEDARPYFVETKKIFDRIRTLKYLSMGMSNSCKIAIEEGANIIRVGTKIFGER